MEDPKLIEIRTECDEIDSLPDDLTLVGWWLENEGFCQVNREMVEWVEKGAGSERGKRGFGIEGKKDVNLEPVFEMESLDSTLRRMIFLPNGMSKLPQNDREHSGWYKMKSLDHTFSNRSLWSHLLEDGATQNLENWCLVQYDDSGRYLQKMLCQQIEDSYRGRSRPRSELRPERLFVLELNWTPEGKLRQITRLTLSNDEALPKTSTGLPITIYQDLLIYE